MVRREIGRGNVLGTERRIEWSRVCRLKLFSLGFGLRSEIDNPLK